MHLLPARMELSDDQVRQYSDYIDNILGESDLKTVSVKKVRVKLQEIVGEDLSDKKVIHSGIYA